ncbi:glutathione S-transferase family protein [Bradyrhizobium sp. WSM 1738]|uniref:glutathione S-transferase family protein n=1 Tax=Bradyrhizobium hereditatis TaxID=2821405 RepID=UPI001CE23668|nr:glutathione S-transferase family protein [Bradyrhizobium hereditatis]MCA6119876.1 glutathione S-transferase family protein [Bradyrhizobium hereditatis]
MYILYHFPFSQHGRRVVALLEEARIPYELRVVDMASGQHMSDDFRKINPNHQVPVLIDGDLTLTESNAILRYLCTKHDLVQWYPRALDARAQVEQWLDWNQCRLGPAVVDIVLNKVFLGPNGDASAIGRGERRLADVAPVLEARLSRSAHVAGDTPTIADLSIASNLTQLSLADASPKTPAILAWYRKMEALSGVRASCAPMQAKTNG